MRAIFENPLMQFIIMILAVMAGIVAVKAAATFLPQGGLPGAFKRVIMAV